ncbi:hypothetical protein CEXT_96611 [Caerostris extrusa]|uniref:Uncharacterized protein n=1 Tax=Caerostris extrusa TaxID=172846 RepID=A0AAV4XMX1_CAEEX|nr:hypothetical protein CEXT_96611 [Caerostris extrusa]
MPSRQRNYEENNITSQFCFGFLVQAFHYGVFRNECPNEKNIRGFLDILIAFNKRCHFLESTLLLADRFDKLDTIMILTLVIVTGPFPQQHSIPTTQQRTKIMGHSRGTSEIKVRHLLLPFLNAVPLPLTYHPLR